MKPRVPEKLKAGKVRESDPYLQTDPDDWYGRFVVKGPLGDHLLLVVSKGDPVEWHQCGFDPPPWEHVSVSVRTESPRLPAWDEMCFVKDLCWDETECVVQFHPPKARYVNYHPFVLHLWKPVGVELPQPPTLAVGPTTGSVGGNPVGLPIVKL